MKRTIQVLSISLVFVMMLCGSSIAGHGGHKGKGKHHGDGFGIFKRLNLTDEQKTNVSNITDKYQEEMKNKRESVFQARENMFTVMSADEFNEANIREAFQKVASAREEVVVLRAKMFSEIKPLLTPEQLALLEERRSRKMERMKKRMNSMPPMFGTDSETAEEE